MKNRVILIAIFVAAVLAGLSSFHLFHISERTEMLRLAELYHQAQLGNDKATIDRVLAPDFAETGYKIFVQTPESVSKKDILGLDFSGLERFDIEMAYAALLNVPNNDTASVSFVRTHRFDGRRNGPFSSLSFHVTYTFERYSDGLKIKRINRNFLIPWQE